MGFNDLFSIDLTDPPVNVNDSVPASFPGSALTPYQILDVDYGKYACIYACQDAEVDGAPKKIEFPMAYLRDPKDTSEASRVCKTLFQDTEGLDWLQFMEVKHDDTCIYGYDD